MMSPDPKSGIFDWGVHNLFYYSTFDPHPYCPGYSKSGQRDGRETSTSQDGILRDSAHSYSKITNSMGEKKDLIK